MRAALSVALVSVIGWLYAGTVSALGREWLSSADASYGIVLAAVAVMLVWRRRALCADRLDPHAPPAIGVLPLLFGLALYLAGTLGADVFLTRLSFVAVVAGATYFLAGPAVTRVMAAPLVFMTLAIPPPTLVVNAVTLPLQLVASRIAETTLMTIGVPVFRDGNVLQLPSTALQVAEACSGLRSLVSLGALAALLAWASERAVLNRAAIVAAAIPIAVIINGLRVALAGVASETWGPAIVTGGWHSFTGWVTFVGSLALLLLIRRLLHLTDGARMMPAPEGANA